MTFPRLNPTDPPMGPSPSHRLPAALLGATLLLGAACDETIAIGDEPAVVTAIGPVRGADSRVFVDYALRDTEFDDADVVVTVCACEDDSGGDSGEDDACVRTACGLAIQGLGGDGTSRVPTVPPRPDLDHAPHVFVWDASAGRVTPQAIVPTEADTRYVIGIAVATEGEGEGDDGDVDPLFSAPFTLDALGVTLDGE